MKIKVSKIAFFYLRLFFRTETFQRVTATPNKKIFWYPFWSCPGRGGCDHPREWALWVLNPRDGRRPSARGERPGPLANFARRFETLFRLREPVGIPRDDGFIKSGFAIEKPRRLIERRQVSSRSIDPCFIGGNRRRDLLPFTAQA